MKKHKLQDDLGVTDDEVIFIKDHFQKVELIDLINLYFKKYETSDIQKFRRAL